MRKRTPHPDPTPTLSPSNPFGRGEGERRVPHRPLGSRSAPQEVGWGSRRAHRLGPGRGWRPKQPGNFLPEIAPTSTRQRRLRALDRSRQPCLPSTHDQDHLDSVLAPHYLHRPNCFSTSKIVWRIANCEDHSRNSPHLTGGVLRNGFRLWTIGVYGPSNR
jgi:hypothetical protein